MQELFLAVFRNQKRELLAQAWQNRPPLDRFPLFLRSLPAERHRHAVFLRKAQHVVA